MAQKIIASKLAACVNILPSVRSFYEWEGKVEDDEESLMMIKTRASLLPELTDFVKQEHSYDVPEVIALDVMAGNPAYLAWIASVTREPRGERGDGT